VWKTAIKNDSREHLNDKQCCFKSTYGTPTSRTTTPLDPTTPVWRNRALLAKIGSPLTDTDRKNSARHPTQPVDRQQPKKISNHHKQATILEFQSIKTCFDHFPH
jgi:hypothetical protein